MEVKEKKEITQTVEIVVSRNCDICKREMGTRSIIGIRNVEMKIVQNDVDCGGTIEQFDICGSCWDEKIIPFMKIFAASPRRSDW